LCHSPGLRDGVSTQGTRVRPYHPTIFGAEITSARIILAGNKFGWSPVLRVGWVCVKSLLRCNPEKWGEQSPTLSTRLS